MFIVQMYLAASNAWLPVADYSNRDEADAHANRMMQYRPMRVVEA